MHQTISGETLKKTKVFNYNDIKGFLENQEEIFLKFKENCLYDSLDFLKSQHINYFNFVDDKKEYKVLKQIIKKEYYDLEKLYPYLGDFLLSMILNKKSIKRKYKTFKFKKNQKNKFVKSLKYEINKKIIELFFDKFSLEYFVKIDFRKNLNEGFVIKENKNNFDLFFENEYYEKEETIFNYKVIVLDGVIQNVSEIHHVLHESAENKTPFVVFCYGTSDEVKHNIITNNKKGITQVFPICFNFDEDSLNVLNDLAVMHDCDLISANNGQSISTEVRNLKTKGKKITISKNCFSFTPVCSELKINAHKLFLDKRIKECKIDSNKDVIINRYKRLFSKSVKVVLPEELKINSDFMREFDYIFKFMSNLKYEMTTIKSFGSKKDLYIPLHFLKILKNKDKSLKYIFNNVEKVIIEI
jgi:hypothetical protein